MPRHASPARLWLRPERPRKGGGAERAVWIIIDSGRQHSTGCSASNRKGAEAELAQHIAGKYTPPRRERDLAQIQIPDVIAIYLKDVVPGHARPEKSAERCERLLEFFGTKTLDDVTGEQCRAYVKYRAGKGQSANGKGRKSTGGGARRDLEDLRAAIGHHAAEGYHRGQVRVVLPERGAPRKRWMTRDEFAKLLWACWRTREIQDGRPTDKYPLRHLVRYLLPTLYTASRPGPGLLASWERGPGLAFMDLRGGRFYRHGQGNIETDKRSPPVKLSPRLLAHLRRWHRLDGGAGRVVTFNGAPIASVKTALARAARLAGIEPVTGYTLRHTAATWLVAKGINTRKIADYLGTSEEMVRKHYGHLAPDYQDEAADAIGRR